MKLLAFVSPLGPNGSAETAFNLARFCQSACMTHIILLIAALAEEADAFMPGQGVIVHTKPHPMRVIEQRGSQIKIVTCGLGKVNAALAVGRYADADGNLEMRVKFTLLSEHYEQRSSSYSCCDDVEPDEDAVP